MSEGRDREADEDAREGEGRLLDAVGRYGLKSQTAAGVGSY